MTLWEQFISPENFALALKRAVRGKKNKRAIAQFLENADENLEQIRQLVIDGKFRTSTYRTIEITDPKRRTIYILPFAPDRIVHHALMNILGPIWEVSFITDSYACINGRGLHSASRRCMEFIRRNDYVLKCDIKKFYPSISHNIMFDIVKKSITDEKILKILHDIIYSGGDGKNLPIGNLCSQWLGNLYLHYMDVFIKQDLRVRDYIRYADDFSLFHNDKKQLNIWRDKIHAFLIRDLKLSFSKSNISRVIDGVDFVRYRHFPKFILLRRRTCKKVIRRIQKINILKTINEYEGGQIASANGWFKFANTYNLQKLLKFDLLKTQIKNTA